MKRWHLRRRAWGWLGAVCFLGERLWTRACDECVTRHNHLVIAEMREGRA
jgi:hypothetical protein